jgi:UDP-N-acetyl-2-amino-2-deoxyglucuronate dehydrogenase
MINKKLRVGIVGCGTIADIHAQAIERSRQLQIRSFYSRGEARAKTAGEKYRTKWTTDWRDFIEDAQLDAVSICTPNGNHMDYGIKAALAGKHVIVEKPIEVTLARAKQLIEKCDERGVRLAIIYQSRFTPSIVWLKEQLAQQVIGKLFMGDASVKWVRTQEYYDSGEWRGTLALDGGGVLINQAIHTIDLLQWLMGGVKTVFGQTGTFTHERLEGEDTAVAVLRYKNTAIGIIEGSTSVLPAQARRIEIHGTKGTAVLDGDAVQIQIGDKIIKPPSAEQKKKVASGSSSPLAGFSIEPHRHQFEAIAGAISKGQDPPVTGRDSLDSLAIVLAVYESAKTGNAVNLDDFIK